MKMLYIDLPQKLYGEKLNSCWNHSLEGLKKDKNDTTNEHHQKKKVWDEITSRKKSNRVL